jgi:hypothetical protein
MEIKSDLPELKTVENFGAPANSQGGALGKSTTVHQAICPKCGRHVAYQDGQQPRCIYCNSPLGG